MAVPANIWLYRITHIANLEHDLLHGLHIAKSSNANPHYLQIGDSSLITYRKEIAAPDPPGDTLSDYIPFYFGPRSPMLFQIASGWEDIRKYPQEEIIYYISSLKLIKSAGLEYFFTDGHARSRTSTTYTNDADLEKLDWGIQHIGVYNKNAEQKVLSLSSTHQIVVPVRISPQKLYYDHL